MRDTEISEERLQAAYQVVEYLNILLRFFIAMLVFLLVFTMLMFLHYKQALSIWPSLHPYHTILKEESNHFFK
ncbi:hypothetical protein DICVIV_12757 [Dictyocaulus viviparus]|uniref:Uncharacterized protein n=1 Tax=Dictyocaulus viviparus TaxID=29172 RepID=A0A0D8X9L1_DICVI|nr:hypothetical protein DICVIV_12757 [Dictyocaulus viviparus]